MTEAQLVWPAPATRVSLRLVAALASTATARVRRSPGTFALLAVISATSLGTGRWLVVFAAGHVGATLATLGGIWIAIETGAASAHLAHSVDVGVSYGFFAVAAILAYRVPRRWRPAYIVAVAAYPVAGTVLFQGFADFGHLLALAIGFALYPLARRA